MHAIAGREVGQPADIGEVTPEWLTTVLRTSGAIDADTVVTTVESQPFAVGTGMLSLLFRAELDYDGPSPGPVSVIVKFPSDDPLQRGTADQLGFYPREIDFYTRLAAAVPYRTPVVHAAMMAEDSTDFVLVMEEVTGLRHHDQRAGVPWDDALTAISVAARLHAAWEGSPDLPDLAGLYLPVLNDGYLAQLPEVFAAGWPGAKDHGGDLLTGDLVDFGDRYADHLPFLLETMYEEPTFIHGDWRADNLFFGDEGELVVVDPQLMGIGTGSYDIGYFVSQSLDAAVRAGREQELVDRYVAELDAAGSTPRRADIERRFVVSVVHCFIYGVTSFQSWDVLPDRSQELLRTFLGRSARAIVDLDGLAILPR